MKHLARLTIFCTLFLSLTHCIQTGDESTLGDEGGTSSGSSSGGSSGSSNGSGAAALDPSFGSGGAVTTVLDSLKDIPRGIVVQSDGKIVVGGQSQYVHASKRIDYAFALVRYDAHGNLDRLFGTGSSNAGSGIVKTPFTEGSAEAGGVALTPTNEIVVVGGVQNGSYTDFAISKYQANGLLQLSFNGTGKKIVDLFGKNDFAKAVVVDSSGNLIVVGQAHDVQETEKFGMVRLSPQGALDTSFGGNSVFQSSVGGKSLTHFGLGRNQGANAVALQSDGRLVVAGYVQASLQRTMDFAVARYLSTGSLDTSFGNQGTATTDFGKSKNDVATSVLVDSGGKILVAGHAHNGRDSDFALARFNPDGRPDTSFGSGGRVVTDFGKDDYITSIVFPKNGGIIAAGYALDGVFYQFAVARYTSAGALDTSFGNGGKLILPVGDRNNAFARAALATNDGSLFFAGETYASSTLFDFVIAKLK